MDGLDENSRDYVNVFTFDNDTTEIVPAPAGVDDEVRKAFLCTNDSKADIFAALGDIQPAAMSATPANITRAIEKAIDVEELVR